jgi:pyruvate dehydrogenase E1 component alpha subunit/2-oxoisovalerate dehydrogenase E1 component alpha subunit
LPLGRDCLKVAEELLFREKILDAATLTVWRSQIIHEIDEAVATAQREPAPDPFTEDWRALASENLLETHLENAAR